MFCANAVVQTVPSGHGNLRFQTIFSKKLMIYGKVWIVVKLMCFYFQLSLKKCKNVNLFKGKNYFLDYSVQNFKELYLCCFS